MTSPPPVPRGPAAVTDAWARIDAWLRRHSPPSYELLRPPADPARIESAQAEMGVRFPAELLASLACHDGLVRWTGLLPVRPPLTVDEIVDTWRSFMEILANVTHGDDLDFDQDPWWHPLWIPFAELDGDTQVLDMREGPGQGALSMTCHDDVGLVEPSWPSLAAYLTKVADVLERGGAVDEESAPFLQPDGELCWSYPLPPGEASTLTPAPTTHRA